MDEIKEKIDGGKNEIHGGNGESTNNNGDSTKEAPPPTDFKVAEIWIKSGQVFLEGTQEFWMDRVRALGLMTLCMDIIKFAKMPEPEKPKIITSPGMGPLNYLKNRLKGKRR